MKNKINYAVGILFLFLPYLLGVNGTYQLLSIFIGSIWLWITTSIEVGGVLCLAALCLLPNIKAASVFSNSFGSSTIIFLIFSMALTYALSSTGVLRRVALFFINNKIATKNIRWFMGFYFLSMLIIGSVMAPTTLFILYFGLVQEIFDILELRRGDEISKIFMIGTAFFASISCAMTPIAHTFPLMALGYYETLTGETISYIEYMKYSIPICLILAAIIFLIFVFKINSRDITNLSFKTTKWTKKEIIASAVFILVVISWLIVGIAPKTFATLNSLGTAFPAMIGVAVLAMLDVSDIKTAFTKGVSWSAIILCAATLALGTYLKSDEFGVITMLNDALTPYLSKINILLLIIAFTVILTNIISNIVTTTVSFNLFVPLLLTTGLFSPIIATIMIGIGASLAYALPSSIAHIALAGGSGWATNKDMLKYGIVMAIISIGVMFGVCSI